MDRNVKIEHSVIFLGVIMEDDAKVKEPIISENAHIDKGIVIQHGSVICDNTLAEDLSRMGSDVKTWLS
jgi:NDP-sugar pyrophosphorylase family protein